MTWVQATKNETEIKPKMALRWWESKGTRDKHR